MPRYNIAPVAGTVTGLRWSLTPETKLKMSIAAQNRSEEHKRKLKEARAHQVLKEPRKLTRMNLPGWHHTEETKAAISRAIILRGPRPQLTRDKISVSSKGKPKTEDHKNKLSLAAKQREMTEERLILLRTVTIGRKWMNKDSEEKLVTPADIDEMIAAGWRFGRRK